jgi:hypothetical protein
MEVRRGAKELMVKKIDGLRNITQHLRVKKNWSELSEGE